MSGAKKNMPIYEYKCNNCGSISEFFVGMGQDNSDIKCVHCGSKGLNRIFSEISVSKENNTSGSSHSNEATTCCGRTERCEKPPCSDDGVCKR